MRALSVWLIVVMLITVAVAIPAQAKTKDWLALAIGVGLVLATDGDCHSNQSVPVFAPEPLYIAPCRIPGLLIKNNYDQRIQMVTAGVLSAAGWDIIDERARQAIIEENRRFGSAVPVVPASWIGTVYTTFTNASEQEYQQYHNGRGWSSSNGSSSRGIKCTVQLSVANGGTHSFNGQGVGYSWSRSEWFSWSTQRYGQSGGSFVPQDRDYAMLAAMTSASNQVTRQAASVIRPTALPAYVPPATNLHCNSCGAEIIVQPGAKFCPLCSKELQR